MEPVVCCGPSRCKDSRVGSPALLVSRFWMSWVSSEPEPFPGLPVGPLLRLPRLPPEPSVPPGVERRKPSLVPLADAALPAADAALSSLPPVVQRSEPSLIVAPVRC